MAFQYSSYTAPLLIAAVISLWVGIFTWGRRAIPSALPISLLALGLAAWCLAYAFEISGIGMFTKTVFAKLEYIGIAFTPMFWLILALNHVFGERRLSRRNRQLLTIIPGLTFLLVLTNEWHHLIWTETHIEQVGDLSVLGVTHGPWFWVHSVYSYILLLIGTVLILRSIIRQKGVYRGQAIALTVAVLVPWLANIIYLAGWSPFSILDPTPFAFTITVLAFTWAIFGFGLTELKPVARENLVEEMRDGVLVVDQRERIMDINPSALSIFGGAGQKLIGRPVQEVFEPWAHLVEKHGDQTELQHDIVLGQGEARRSYEVSVSNLHDDRARFLGWLLILRDITERKRADEQLRQLSRAVEASPTSIMITDTGGRIVYANPKVSEVTGYTQQELLGKNPNLFKSGQTPVENHRQLWGLITTGREWRGEFVNRKKNGDIYWESASISPIFDAVGKIAFYVAVKEDITDRKRAEQELAIARDQALEGSRMKSQLLAKVSHELRTPLGGILGFAELLDTDTFGPLNAGQQDAIRQIIDSSHYLSAMVNELLDEAQSESKTMNLRHDHVSIPEMMNSIRGIMAVLAERKGLAFSLFIDPIVPEIILGDPHRLRQVLTNLIGNAIKYTRTGSVQVRVLMPDPQHWAVQVRDTGAGIPLEAQKSIFEPFVQVDNAITYENRGTGLGLSIARNLVELMGGEIRLESQVGQGSTFTVILPLEQDGEKK